MERRAGAIPGFITPHGRDLRIDILRGAMVMAMVVEHVDGIVPVQALAAGNRFFASAAEGFVLISGLMAGLVFHRILEHEGFGAVVRRALARAGELYLLTVAMTLLLLPLSETLQLPWAEGIDLAHSSTEIVVGVLALHRTYYLADVMLLFTLLFLLTPLAIALMANHKTGLLLGGSWLLWAVQQFFPAQVSLPWSIESNAMFGLAAWQVLFVAGMVVGYHRDRLPQLDSQAARRWQIATGIALVALIVLNRVLLMPTTGANGPLWAGLPNLALVQDWIQNFIFGKAALRPGRIITALIVIAFLVLTLTRQWRWIGRPAQWLFGGPGKHSLYAFSAHVAVIAVAALALKRLTASGSAPAWANLAVQVAILAAVWLLVRYRVLGATSRTRPVWRVVPAVLAVVALAVLPGLPAPAKPVAAIQVSDAVLARARAFGTPISRLGLAGHLPPTAATVARATPVPAAIGRETPAARQGVQAAATAIMTKPAAQGATPVPDLATTPQAINLTLPAALVIPGAGGGNAGALNATQGIFTATRTSSIEPVRTPGLPGATVTSVPTSALPEPLPPLPSDDKFVKNKFVHVEAGRAYSLTFRSVYLNRDMNYWVYVPPHYGETQQRYPVLYMLHGSVGLIEEWPAYGLVDSADRAFAAGILSPFIIVLPQGDTSFWANWADNGPRWGDYLAYEVVGEVDAHFGTLRSPGARAIGGLSMGAWGALHHGFVHPDVFGVVLASSPTTYQDHDYLWFLGSGAEYKAKDPRSLALTAPGAPGLRIWIDVGQDDPWGPAATEIHEELLSRGIVHDWHLYPGGHGGEYWATHVPDYLTWIAGVLPVAGP